MRQIETTKLADKIVKKLGKDSGLSEGCVYCFGIRGFFKLTDKEKLKILKKQTAKKN
jgi:hypothetical protein